MRFVGAAEVFEDGEEGAAIAAIGQQLCDMRRGGGVGGEREDAVAGGDVGVDHFGGPGVEPRGSTTCCSGQRRRAAA